jgi:Xaa-Pro aminopeptidase
VEPRTAIGDRVREALAAGRVVHLLPPYRGETTIELAALLGVGVTDVAARVSLPLVEAVVAQRSVKDAGEVAEIEAAIAITRDMHLAAMRTARPGVDEREVVGAMQGVVGARGAGFSFAPIFSVHGETLHNHAHVHTMAAGQMAVNDSGAEALSRYAGDITRTLPIGGRFSGVQRDLYAAVLRSQLAAIDAVAPGVPYRDVHLLASRTLAEALVAMGVMRGDPAEAVAAGAHALFFPHGLGHMMGLDVHDMEALGEQHVGYDAEITRSDQFGLRSLRLGRRLQPGFVLTVEPGLYFIPALIDRWKAERRGEAFIDYAAVDALRGAGGIRIEDNVVVTATGGRVLGPPIPKAVDEVEALLR